jgi:hypothetical protein
MVAQLAEGVTRMDDGIIQVGLSIFGIVVMMLLFHFVNRRDERREAARIALLPVCHFCGLTVERDERSHFCHTVHATCHSADLAAFIKMNPEAGRYMAEEVSSYERQFGPHNLSVDFARGIGAEGRDAQRLGAKPAEPGVAKPRAHRSDPMHALDKYRKAHEQPFEHRMSMHRLIGTEGLRHVDTHCTGKCQHGRQCDCESGHADEAALYDEPKPSLWQRIKTRIKAKLAEWNRNHWIGDEE